jgi:hypothetical protein
LFSVETLADLEKAVAEGRTAEHVVASLAEKTPSDAYPNVHHRTLIEADLRGQEIEMTGRIMVAAGEYKRAPDGTLGMHIDEFPEAVMLLRWKNQEFNEAEREVARRWREELATHEPERMIAILQNILPAGTRISDLESLKAAIDEFCESNEREVVALALHVLEIPDRAQAMVLGRWAAAGDRRWRRSRLMRRTCSKLTFCITSALPAVSSLASGPATERTWRTSTTCPSRWHLFPGTAFIVVQRGCSSRPTSRMSSRAT